MFCEGSHFTGNADDRSQVSAMSFDGKIQHNLAEHIDEPLPNLNIGIEDVDAGVIISQAQFA